MNQRFDMLLRHMPGLMVWLAIAYYFSTVAISIAAGNDMVSGMDLGRDTLSPLFKLKAFMLVFVQPLVNATALLFGAALLWRIDRLIASRVAGAVQ